MNKVLLIVLPVVLRIWQNCFNFKHKPEINPDPKTEIIVSRARVQAFKAWMNGEVY